MPSARGWCYVFWYARPAPTSRPIWPTRGARARPAGPPRPDYKQRRRYPKQMLQRDLERIARQLSQGVIATLREASVEELAEFFPAVGRLLRQAERGAAAAERDRG